MVGESSATAGPRVIAAFAPFRVRSFRYQWPADLCTAWALEMETLILGWYVLVESGSVTLLTVFGALQYVGTLVSPVLGTVGDRIGLRNLLALMRMSYSVFAALLLGLALTQRLDPYAVLVVAALCGLVRPSDIGMRSALVGATVPARDLVAAMSISRTTMDSSKIGGALAGAGVMAAFGIVPAYVAIVTIHLAGFVLTLLIDGGRAGHTSVRTVATPTAAIATSPPAAPRTAAEGASEPGATAPASTHTNRPSPWRDLREGIVYVWRTPRLLAAMTVAALVNVSAYPFSSGLMPYIARDVFGLGQAGLGWLASSFAAGALIGSLAMSLLGPRVRPARTMLATTVVWFVCLFAFTHLSSPGLAMVALAAAGAAQSVSMIGLQILLLRTSEMRLRGRIMGVRMLAIYPLPLGLLIAGALIPELGYHVTATLMLLSGLAMTAAVALGWRRELMPVGALANGR